MRKKLCKVEGCNNSRYAKGYCVKHYGRWKKNGDPLLKKKFQHLPPNERFWMKVKKRHQCECWEWQESNRKGYGCLWVNRKYISAHRFSWILHHGEVPSQLQVLHKCDNPLCVNPDHLFLGTQDENTQDRVRKERSAGGIKTNSRGKLSKGDVVEINKLLNSRLVKQVEIAKAFNVSPPTINRISNGATYGYYSG